MAAGIVTRRTAARVIRVRPATALVHQATVSVPEAQAAPAIVHPPEAPVENPVRAAAKVIVQVRHRTMAVGEAIAPARATTQVQVFLPAQSVVPIHPNPGIQAPHRTILLLIVPRLAHEKSNPAKTPSRITTIHEIHRRSGIILRQCRQSFREHPRRARIATRFIFRMRPRFPREVFVSKMFFRPITCGPSCAIAILTAACSGGG